MCVSQICQQLHSSKIVCTLFNQEKIAFCVLRKWYIKRCTTEQIFDCFPVLSLVQYDTIRCFIYICEEDSALIHHKSYNLELKI